MEEEIKEQKTQETRYPVLEIITVVFQVLAVFVLVSALIVVANIYFRADVFDTGIASSMGIVFVIGIIGFVLLWASAEIINVFVHIEENTRRTAELLEKQIEMTNKN
ncbi:MAG: hypothetical protein ABWZ66_13900 [Pyrinomonadaceae bacterium]